MSIDRRDDADNPSNIVNIAQPASVEAASVSIAGSPWRPEHYNPLITGSGARKLADSAVAPLVAFARGYESVQGDQAKEFAKRWGIGDARTKRGGQFLASFRDDGDALVMPWYSVDQQKLDVEDLVKESTHNLQLRPKNARVDERGRPVKYEFLIGSDTVLDFHPATSRRWVHGARRVLLAEGLLKADSALTAQLRSHVRDEELYVMAADQNRQNAIERLAALIERIPSGERIAIIGLAGVGNWKQNPEWAGVDVRQKDVLIAFDGDVNTNYNVWSQASQLFTFLEASKRGVPHLVDLASHPMYESAAAATKGFGLDDFFAGVGAWRDLDVMLSDGLPERPARPDDARVGEWRVASDGLSTEECAPVTDSFGNVIGVSWELRVPLGGRMLYSQTRRTPTDDELRTGIFGAGLAETDHAPRCAIEVRWLDKATDREVTATITGPARIAAMDPRDWDRAGAIVPEKLLYHPEWPPKRAMEWLKAVKANEPARMQEQTIWATSGWVPVPGEQVPAYIVGSTVIAPSDEAAMHVQSGVTNAHLAKSSRFGLSDVYTVDDLRDPTQKHDLREDLLELVDTFILDSPWKTKPIAVCVLAAALRPTIPRRNATTFYVVGAAGKGKSWTVRQIMSFWQARAGAWVHELPGSANDTFASTEHALSLMPIWVADDLAPNVDARHASNQESQLESLIRSVFNDLGKRRMNADGTSRSVSEPRSLFVITAENEPGTQSIRERIVNLNLDGLRDGAVERATALGATTLTASRVTAAMIRWQQRSVAPGGEYESWEELIEHTTAMYDYSVEMAKEVLIELGVDRSQAARPAGIVADLCLGLIRLSDLLESVGLKSMAEEHIHWNEGGWLRMIAEQVVLSHLDKAEQAPGVVLMEALRGVLTSGKAYVAAENGSTPFGFQNGARLNALLGWKSDGVEHETATGTRIGYLIIRDGRRIIVFNANAAFDAAKNAYPTRIGHGAKAPNHWRDWAAQGYWSTKWAGPDKNSHVRDVKPHGKVVAVDLDTFLDIELEDIPGEVENRALFGASESKGD
jgi:hypothetical protein